MNIYIDLGCHGGDTVEQFRNWRYLKYSPDIAWLIYAFDPNPNFAALWKKRSDDKTFFECKAAWTTNGTIEYTERTDETAQGSTVMKAKQDWGMGNILTVPCFDFSEWLRQFKNDYVIVKMDIEGAEFPILEKMISDGTITIPYLLLVEFHPNKVRTYTTDDKNNLVERITALGVNVREWH